MTVEDLVCELEFSTSRLIAALLARDHKFLEYFEQRRDVLRKIQSLPPDAVPSSLLPRLQSAWQGGQIAEEGVRLIREEIEVTIAESGRPGGGG